MKNERRQIKSRNREDRSAALYSLFLFLPLCSYYSYFCRSVIIILISAALYSSFLFLPLCSYYSYFSHATLITFEGVEDPECGELEGGAMLSDQWTTIKCRLDTFQEGKGELVLVREISREIKTQKMRKETTT